MDITDRLYVEIVPFQGPRAPHPHPISEAQFDLAYVYKVLGMYNPSETSECYLVLANPNRELWFIPQRHVRAFRLLDSDEMFIPKSQFGESPTAVAPAVEALPAEDPAPATSRWREKLRLRELPAMRHYGNAKPVDGAPATRPIRGNPE